MTFQYRFLEFQRNQQTDFIKTNEDNVWIRITLQYIEYTTLIVFLKSRKQPELSGENEIWLRKMLQITWKSTKRCKNS